jgi:hypothetical protein
MSKYAFWIAAHAMLLGALLPTTSQATGIHSLSRCLQPLDGNSANSTPIVISPCTGAAKEQWSIEWGHFTGLDGKCLDAQSGSSANGTPLILYTCSSSGAANQQWSVTSAGRITGIAGKCIDLADDHVTSDVNIRVILNACNSRVQQYWRIQ